MRLYRVQFFATQDHAYVSEKNIEFFHRDYSDEQSWKSVKQRLSLTRQRLYKLAMQEIEQKYTERFGINIGGPLKCQQSSKVQVINPGFKH